VYWCENMRSSEGGVVYEDSEEAGEGNSWRGEVWGGCSSAGFCSGEAELEAARRSCRPISMRVWRRWAASNLQGLRASS
jgi:hypothetical protein